MATNGADKSLGDVVSEVSEKASLLVREEIELAKAEMELKMKRLVRGAAVGITAGFFALLGLIFAFHSLAWGLNDWFEQVWLGFLITTILLFLLAALAAAGVLAVFALIYLFEALAWFFVDLFNWNTIWPGFLLTFGVIVVIGVLAGALGVRWLRSGAPPTPDLAIEEAKRTREMLDQQKALNP